MASDESGLYGKYEVRKDGNPVEDCFVLEPQDDHAARMALVAYADATENEGLADDLLQWIAEIRDDYEISKVIEGWKVDGTLYRRVITRGGETVIEKGVGGRYVPDHRRER